VLSVDAERALARREWSGNIRELRNLMERTLLLTSKPTLAPEDFTDGAVARTTPGQLPFPATIAAITRAAAHAMLDLCGGNKSEAARQLGVSRPRLLRILETDAELDSSDDAEVDHA
jgi:DNA-binding NtrC family response regulator